MLRSRFLKDLDLTLILSSLIVAFFVWLIAKQDETRYETLTVPVEVTVANPFCQVVYEPKEMQIKVEYPTSLRSYVNNESFYVALDTNDAHRQAGIDEFRDIPQFITLDDLKPAPGLPTEIRKVMFMSSNRARLSARLHTLEVDLQIPTRGNVAAGYELAGPITAENAENLRLVGAPDRLAGMTDPQGRAIIKTEPVDLEGRDAGATVYVNILVPEGFLIADTEREQKILPPSECRVIAHIPIQEERIERIIRNVPISLEPFTVGVRFEHTPTTADVRIMGFRSLVNQIADSYFVIHAKSPPNENPGFVGEVVLEARFADHVADQTRQGVDILDITPSSVKLTVTAIEMPPFTSDREPGADTQRSMPIPLPMLEEFY